MLIKSGARGVFGRLGACLAGGAGVWLAVLTLLLSGFVAPVAHSAAMGEFAVTTPNEPSAAAVGGIGQTNLPVVLELMTRRGTYDAFTPLYIGIRGDNIEDATDVLFGGISAEEFTVSGDTVFALLPQGAGLVDVQVVTPGGTSSPNANSKFTYLGPATITSVTVAQGSPFVRVDGFNLFNVGAMTLDGRLIIEYNRNAEPDSPGTMVGGVLDVGEVPRGWVTVALQTMSGGVSATVYVGAPTATAISSTSGPTAGGESVTITGDGYFGGRTSVTIGGVAVPASAVTLNSSRSLTFATPPHAAGNVEVSVTTHQGTSSIVPGGYTYVGSAPAPTLSAISPSSGSTAGGTAVTLTGSGFVAGSTSVSIGGTVVPAASVTVASATALTFVAPAHAAGSVEVTVTTPNGTSAAVAGGFTYASTEGAPVVTAVVPNRASYSESAPRYISIEGDHLAGATDVLFGGVSTELVFFEAGALTAMLPEGAGVVDVQVITPQGTSLPHSASRFTYLGAPTITSVTAVQGSPIIRIEGANLFDISAVSIEGAITDGATVVTPNGPIKVAAAEFTRNNEPDNPGTSVTATIVTGTVSRGSLSVNLVASGEGASATVYVGGEPAPTLSAIAPSAGPVAGGTTVTLTGSGFVVGSTSVSIGGTVVPANSVTVASATTLTFVSPAHAAGSVEATVTTPNGTSAAVAGGFTYEAPLPIVSTVSPSSGSPSGNTSVRLTGDGFVQGQTSVTMGGEVISQLTVIDPQTLTFVAPPHSEGNVQITVTTPRGTSAPAPGGYTYAYSGGVPVVREINPRRALYSQSPVYMAIRGDNLTDATDVLFGGVSTESFSIEGDTLWAMLPEGSGVVDVQVVTPAGTSATTADGRFTYAGPARVTSAFVDSSGTAVVLEGENLLSLSNMYIANRPAFSYERNNEPDNPGTRVVGVVSPGTPLVGWVNVSFLTPFGGVNVNVYGGPPTATALSPASGPTAGGQSVTITGDGYFGSQTSVTIGGVVIPASAVTLNSSSSLTFVTPAHATGNVEVSVTTQQGTSGVAPGGYTYVGAEPAPTLSAVSPGSGSTAGGTSVTLNGSGFVSGSTSVSIGGTVVPASGVTVASATALTFVTPAHAAGATAVTVTTPNGTSPAVAGGFSYVAPTPSPTVSAISPSSGPVAGGTVVALTGTDFVTGSTSVAIGGTVVAAADVSVASATSLSFTTPAHAAGAVEVTLITPNGTSAAVAGGFTYVAPTPAPTVSAISPSSGPVAGGTLVALTGTDFVTGSTSVAIGGTVVAAADVSVASATSLSFTTPAHAAGIVEVTLITPNGTSAAVAGGFTYVASTPVQGPVAHPVNATVLYGSTDNPIALSLSGGATSSVAITRQPNHGTATASGTAITYTPSAGYGGADDFSYTATGPGGPSAAAEVSVTVGPATIALDATVLADGRTGASYSQVRTASGGMGPYAYTVATGALPMGLQINASTGEIFGTPTAAGTSAFSLRARDASTGTGPYEVLQPQTITITDATPPIAGPVSARIAHDSRNAPIPLNLTGGAATVTGIVTQPSHGVATANGATISYTPDRGYSGPDSFTYRATNADGTSEPATVTITVDPQSPVAGPAAATILEGSTENRLVPPLSGGTAASVTVIDQPTHGVLTLGERLSFLYTPSAGFVGQDVFTYQAINAGGASATATFTITVNRAVPAVSPPVGSGSSATIAFNAVDAPIGLNLTGGAAASVTLSSPPSHGSAVVSGTAITYTPTAGYFGTDTFQYTATNTAGTSAPATVILTVSPPPAPVAAPVATTVAANSSANPIPLNISGAALLNVSASTAPTHGSVAVTGATITYTPTPGYSGTDSFTYRAINAGGTSAPATVSLTITAPRLALSDIVLSGQVDVAYSQTIAAEAGLAPYGFAVVGARPLPPGLSLVGAVLSGAPSVAGSFDVSIQATDVHGAVGTRTYALVIAPRALTLPIAASTQATVGFDSVDNAIQVSLSGGPATSVSIASEPVHGTIKINGLDFLYTPDVDYSGPDSFTFTASNASGSSAAATVSITVSPPPAPTVAPVVAEVPYGAAGHAITLLPSGSFRLLLLTTGPAHGSVEISGATAIYTPAIGYFGSDSFAYSATGRGGLSSASIVSISIPRPSPPVVDFPAGPVVVSPVPASSSGVSPTVVNLGARVDGVIDGFRVTDAGAFGSVQIVEVPVAAAGVSKADPSLRQDTGSAPSQFQLVYTQAANFMGTESVTLVAFGPGGQSRPITFSFQVTGKARDISGEVPSNAQLTLEPTTGLVGGPFQGLRITRAPAFGAAVVQGLSIVFTPGAAAGGATSLDYVVALPFGESAAGRVALVSNLVPAAQSLSVRTVQGRSVSTRVSDAAGGPFTASAVVSVAPALAGSATLSATGDAYDLTFTPAGAFAGEATVTFSLTNAFGTSHGVLTVMVEARPDPALDPEVRGMATGQVTAARRFADAQVGNFQRRLQSLRNGANTSSNDLRLNLGLGADDEMRDPRQALRRQLGLPSSRQEPGLLDQDRDRDLMTRSLWADQPRAGGGSSASVAQGLRAPPSGGSRSLGHGVGVWTSGTIDWGRQDATGQRDTRFTTQGVSGGLDIRIDDRLIVGGGIGYGEDRSRIADSGTATDGQAVTGALYASWRPMGALYVAGVAGVADLQFASRRRTLFPDGQPSAFSESERSGGVRFASLSLGRMIRTRGIDGDVYGRVDARQMILGAFTETAGGLSGLSWDELKQDSLSANLGASVRWTVETRRRGVFVPGARLEWSHELETIGLQGVRYADWAASPTYLVPLDAWSRNALNINLDVEWSLSNRLAVSMGYRATLGDSGSSQGGGIEMKYGW